MIPNLNIFSVWILKKRLFRFLKSMKKYILIRYFKVGKNCVQSLSHNINIHTHKRKIMMNNKQNLKLWKP